jgi:large subunit ribosomal protein L15
MRLSDLRPNPGARKARTRVGRGHGSGLVKTSGRGQKGQKARTGGGIPAYFEGGQNRFSQRMPYLGGFKNPFRKEYIVVNLADLAVFEAGETVTAAALAKKGLIRPRQAKGLLKVLGNGKIEQALHVSAHKVSAHARARIEAAGGSISLLALPNPAKRQRERNAAKKAARAATTPGAGAPRARRA